MALESEFQKDFKEDLEKAFPGCLIIKGNSTMRQGVPDLLLLHEDRWAMLELKRRKNSRHETNQDYYVDKLNEMSYSSFVTPENAQEVISEIQSSFRSRR